MLESHRTSRNLPGVALMPHLAGLGEKKGNYSAREKVGPTKRVKRDVQSPFTLFAESFLSKPEQLQRKNLTRPARQGH